MADNAADGSRNVRSGDGPGRIHGFDLARALAVFGMVVVNFKIVMGAGAAGPVWLASLLGLIEGRAAATFVVLAGVGLSLMTRAAREAHDHAAMSRHRNSVLRRAAVLFLVGALYTPIWPADILHFYGVYLAVAAWLLGVTSRTLLLSAGSLVALFPVLLLTLDYERGWDWSTLSYEGLWTLDGAVRHLFFNGFHPVIPWLAFVLLGMALGRLDLRRPPIRRRVMAWGLATALVFEATSRLAVIVFSHGADEASRELVDALFGRSPMPPMPQFVLAAGGLAVAVIAASVGVAERWREAWWLDPLVATGQLALTLYVAHVLVGMGILEAMGWLGGRSLTEALLASWLFCMASVVFAVIWRRWFRRGPLEALLRAVTRF